MIMWVCMQKLNAGPMKGECLVKCWTNSVKMRLLLLSVLSYGLVCYTWTKVDRELNATPGWCGCKCTM